MPFAPRIRKQIIAVLEQYAIPALQGETFTQVWAGPPFDFNGAPTSILRKCPLPPTNHHPLDYIVRWNEYDLHYKRVGRIGLVCQGGSVERYGITEQIAQRLKAANEKVPAGITAFQLQAPAIFHIPAGLPHGGNEVENPDVPLQLLVFDYNDDELFLRYYSPETGPTHHLHIMNEALLRFIYQYVELRQRNQLKGAQLTMLLAMTQLKTHLATHNVNISNSAWPNIGDQAIAISATASQKNSQLCHQVIDYIQQHLHANISLEHLAETNNISSVHLNRVFKKEIGMTVMRYVTHCRLEAAKYILRDDHERVGDIANLVGFANVQSFDGVFKRHEGISPLAYRRKYSKTIE
jgi:AraC-like DNA-binding protein